MSAPNMPGVTIVTLQAAQFQEMLDAAVAKAVEAATAKSGERMTLTDVAAHYRCSPRTVQRRVQSGAIAPPELDGNWLRAKVLRWDRERAQ